MALKGDAQGFTYGDDYLLQEADRIRALSGNAQGMDSYRQKTSWEQNPREAISPLQAFSPTSAVGEREYSKELAAYLNSLSLEELASLDMDITGLMRTDLDPAGTINGNDLLGQGFSPDQIATISKYRNAGVTNDGYGGGWYNREDPNAMSGDNPQAKLTESYWRTRNNPDAQKDMVYGTEGGKWGALDYNEPSKNHLKYIVPALMGATTLGIGAGAMGLLGGGAAAGAGATGAGAPGTAAMNAAFGTGATGAGSTMGPIAGLKGAEATLLGGNAGGYAGAAGLSGNALSAADIAKYAGKAGNALKSLTATPQAPQMPQISMNALSRSQYRSPERQQSRVIEMPEYLRRIFYG